MDDYKDNPRKERSQVEVLLLSELRDALGNNNVVVSRMEQEYQEGKAMALGAGALKNRPNLSALEETMDFFWEHVLGFYELICRLGEYLEAELDKPQYKGRLTWDQMLKQIEDGPEGRSLWDVAVEAAYNAQQKQGETETPGSCLQPLAKIDYPLDKVNGVMWRGNLDDFLDENGMMTVGAEKHNSRKEANVNVTIDFSHLEDVPGLEKVRELTVFDKWVYVACYNEFIQNGEYTSIPHIAATMGHDGYINNRQRGAIEQSLNKMMAIPITIDNAQELLVNKHYPLFTYNGNLLPMEWTKSELNGNLVKSTVHFFREPPLITFAKGRKQLTTVIPELLRAPLDMTESNLRLQDYFLWRTAQMRRPGSKLPRKILYGTIYKNCGITTAKQKKRTQEKVTRLLNHYKSCGWIAGYKNEPDYVIITLGKKK